MDGILPVYKKAGMTSRRCVSNYIKFYMKKIGHAGTLDPSS